MEFKEAIKIRERMCCYYQKCKDCPLEKFADGCIDAMRDLGEIDEYEKILEEWSKEHPVMTNADKYIEVIKNTFGEDLEKTKIRGACVERVRGIKCIHNCEKCLRWWDEEYKEP